MGDWSSATYISSQVFIVLAFTLLGITYLIKRRLLMLTVVVLSNIAFVVGYGLLSAWVGLAMSVIAIACNLTSYVVDSRRKCKEVITSYDWFMLWFWGMTMFVVTVIVQDGFFTWFAFFASFVFMFSMWQKNVLVYQLLGFVVGICWLLYNYTIENFFGIIAESILLCTVLIGLIVYFKKSRESKKLPNHREVVK